MEGEPGVETGEAVITLARKERVGRVASLAPVTLTTVASDRSCMQIQATMSRAAAVDWRCSRVD